MRKALIAAIVASALFAVGALAANFAVTSSDVSSGTGDVASCADEALVEYTTRAAVDSTTQDFLLDTITVTFVDAGTTTSDCNGASADVAVGSGDGDPSTNDTLTWDDLASATVTSGVATFTVPGATDIPVSPVEQITVLANGNAIATSGP